MVGSLPAVRLIDAPLLPHAGALLTLAAVLVAGVLLGSLAKRARLPRVTGQILAGILLGREALHLFDPESVHTLDPLKEFALGLMGVTIGAHLNVRRLRNAGKRLLAVLVFEATLTPLLVFAAVAALPGVGLSTALLLAALGVSTAPATIVAVVKEERARGVFVKTLVAAVAINNIVCIFLFEVSRYFAREQLAAVPGGTPILDGVQAALVQLGGAALLGGTVGMAMTHAHRLAWRQERIATSATVALLITYGLAAYLDVSPLLACMFLGLTQTNATPHRERVIDTEFHSFEPAILAVFFTLAGMHLSFEDLEQSGLVALVFFGARIVGKLLVGNLSMRVAGAPARVRRWLGPALLPQAGLAIGLVLLIEDDPGFASAPAMLQLFLTAVLTAVTLNEIVGPITTRIALRRSGESGNDRTRLIDFLQEENIVVGLRAGTKEEAIEQLTDVLISSHHLSEVDRDALFASVMEREAQVSTCLGGGLFVPHASLPEGSKTMVGVMGLSREGLSFPTPDGAPVHCVVLLATPPEQRQRHLEVLGLLARVVGTDLAFQSRLFAAESPAHAYEMLHGEETEEFNYFLEDD